MAYMDNTRPHAHCAHEITLCVTKDEAEAYVGGDIRKYVIK